MLNRRSFLVGLAAPVIIPAVNLMPVKLFVPPSEHVFFGTTRVLTHAHFDGTLKELIVFQGDYKDVMKGIDDYMNERLSKGMTQFTVEHG